MIIKQGLILYTLFFLAILTVGCEDTDDPIGNIIPRAIILSSTTVLNNQPVGTTVGSLSTADFNTDDTHIYSLVSGEGSTDNSNFTIDGLNLNTSTALNFENQSSYSIRIQTDDGNGGTLQMSFTITEEQGNVSEYLYLSNNAPTENGIIILKRFSDGTLEEASNSPVSTGGTGDADDGDFDGQWSLRRIDNWLLVVNAGEHTDFGGLGTVSVFSIGDDGATLTRIDQNTSTEDIDNISSEGERPVSISYYDDGSTTWVLVANQHSNPIVGGGVPQDSDNRNIAAYTFNKNTGVLTFSRIVATYNSANYGGPSQVDFSPDGQRVAVTTWGIAHLVPAPDTLLQGDSRTYVYSFSGSTNPLLTPIGSGFFQETGISGSIGFSWNSQSNRLFISNFNVITDNRSVTVLNITDTDINLASSAGIGTPGNEACWTLLTPNDQRLYVASFAGNLVSYFNVASDGSLSDRITYSLSATVPDTKDMYRTENGQYFYVSGALVTHTINMFRINADGSLEELSSSPYAVPSAVGTSDTEQAFLGFVGAN